MKVITKRDLAVIKGLLLCYPNLSGVTITDYKYLGKHTGMVGARIPEERSEVVVSIRNGEPDMIVMEDLNPKDPCGPGWHTFRRYKVLDGKLIPLSPNLPNETA